MVVTPNLKDRHKRFANAGKNWAPQESYAHRKRAPALKIIRASEPGTLTGVDSQNRHMYRGTSQNPHMLRGT